MTNWSYPWENIWPEPYPACEPANPPPVTTHQRNLERLWAQQEAQAQEEEHEAELAFWQWVATHRPPEIWF